MTQATVEPKQYVSPPPPVRGEGWRHNFRNTPPGYKKSEINFIGTLTSTPHAHIAEIPSWDF